MAENLEQSSIRELSLEETEAVSGASWGPLITVGYGLLGTGIAYGVKVLAMGNGGGRHAGGWPGLFGNGRGSHTGGGSPGAQVAENEEAAAEGMAEGGGLIGDPRFRT
jgi:hypothetical protein